MLEKKFEGYIFSKIWYYIIKKRKNGIGVIRLNRTKGVIVGLIAAVMIILTSFTTIINFITDYFWFKEVGYDQVFLTKLITQLKIGVPVFVVLTVLIYLYLLSIKKDYYKKVETTYISVSEKRVNQIALLASVAVSFISSITFTSSLWYELLRFFNSTSFNVADPIFNLDVSFYMFQLPFIQQIYYLLIGFVFMIAVLTLVFYLVMMSIRRPTLFDVNRDTQEIKMPRGIDPETIKKLINVALRQLTVLGIIFFLIQGAGYVLKTYDLLYSKRGVAYGASFTDVHVNLWLFRIMTVLSIASAVLFAIGARARRIRLALTGPVLMIAITILGNIAALGVQNFIVSPDEISKESEYLQYNIKYTKMAYGLNDIEEKFFAAEQNLTRADLENNKETIQNIRINDYRPTKQFYNQRQGIRLYYQFNDVDIDRYMINGQYSQVFLAAREIDYKKINDQWINQYIKYTHGYGIALSPVNTITSEGQPKLLVSNIPPQSNVTNLRVTEPRIYFGELTNNYIITNTKEKEFDYPSGDENAESIYEGTAGIRLGGINKLLFAIKQRSLKMLISGNVTSDSRILLYRNINERVRRIAPFLEYDEDPYLVIDNGRLFWIIDGYTVSSNYPYAEPYISDDRNYISNSVKVVIDAYNGDTTFYAANENDPVILTLGKIFPQLLTSMDRIPEGIKSHIRYPQTLFDIQANVYKVYHMTDTDVFYQGEDLWDISNEIYERDVQQIESNYFIMKLPGEKKEEFALSIPYTPKGKPNMTALLVARSDGENYGELIIYKLPKQKNVYGPMQIESRIDQDSDISKEFSLWGQRGSTYIRGNLLTIPIEDSLIYVEPIYIRADNENSLPEVKRVIVAYGDRIAYEETLEEALSKLFGTDVDIPETTVPQPPVIEGIPDNTRDLITKANQIFNSAQEAQRTGNWAEYGKNIDELKLILERLNQLTEAQQ